MPQDLFKHMKETVESAHKIGPLANLFALMWLGRSS